MTGREGETFPGFFYGRRGQPDAGVREVRSSQEEGDGLGMPSLGVPAIYGLEEVAAREAPPAFWWRCIGGARKGRGMHYEGPIPALPVAGLFGGAVCCLQKNQTFFCVFSVC